ncbi:hypothetical protein COCCADRAFT_33179 [Bipolaris zeicola 26-R-13]|uniref:Trafficking protein particle complex II-specific subunit 65 IgD3 domain-containing protein n=1 Tax=Cochliobolus carbonum (strain 26-R-13) TaxID=930089 RepID=W6YIZ2_COCC2|nr:uncharacterized protein COCCADRAFT_33179 [Bipolaris zeicola 26-R-13]EUC37653.1 hypothetical protein COCCADRAFT_33179 [Bipolaris zeicola 26-R-13]
MAADTAEAQPRQSLEFVESSVLEAVVPAKSEIDIKTAIEFWDGAGHDDGSILPFLEQRQVLLLDSTLKGYLERLVVNVEAFAFSTAPPPEQDPKSGTLKELIYSGTIKPSDEPSIVCHGEGGNAHTFVIWKVDIFIARPQGRFHKPAVYFQPTASFKPAENPKDDALEDDYLPSRVPTPLNLLQSFENDPALVGVHPRLSAMRISKVTPSAPVAREMVRPIRNGQKPIFRVLPPLIWRVRYSRLHASVNDLSLIASLDLEVAQFATYDVRIKNVKLALHGGKTKELSTEQDATVSHKPGDQLTYLYKIMLDLSPDGTPSLGTKGHYLILNVEANVTMSSDCRPDIAIEWKTPVDFASEQASGHAKAFHRPTSSMSQATNASNPDALVGSDSQDQHGHALSSNEVNVTLTISGPPSIQVGEIFTWDVFIVNRSDKMRRLAILVIVKRPRDGEKKHRSHPSTSSVGGPRVEKRELLATAVTDENVVYAKQKSTRTETADLICLTTDIRVGTRHRLLYQLNSRWIYGKIPLLHSVVFLLQMAAVSLLTRKYNQYYAARPVLTTMITNAVLGGIADTVAQTLTAVRERAVRKKGGPGKDDFLAIEIHDLDKRNPFNENDLIPDSKKLPPPFDFERTTRFMSYGFLMSPIQHRWFRFLSATFPVTKTATWMPALKRVAFDQFLFAPAGLAAFFTFMTIAEGGGKRAVQRKFQDVYVPALKANYMVWPAVQIINFRVMPIQYQIPFVSSVGIAWTAYLSLTNSAEDA